MRVRARRKVATNTQQTQQRSRLSWLKTLVRPNFYRLHLAYFVVAILVSSAILWGSNTSGFRLRYIDALFLCCSAMCSVGLTTVNLGSLNGFQQSVLLVNMLMGDLSLVSTSVVVVRRYFFGKYIREFLQHSQAAQRIASDIEADGCPSTGSDHLAIQPARQRQRINPPVEQENATTPTRSPSRRRQHYIRGYGGFPAPWDYAGRLVRWTYEGFGTQKKPDHSYLSFEPELDHRGRFRALTSEQERELGGVEYRALRLLTWLLPAYAVFWLSFIIVVMTPYVCNTNAGNVIREAQPGNLSPAWWSVFVSVSAYTNSGLSLLNANMIPLGNNYIILIFTGMVIFTGNTFYPILLRLTIWLLSKIVPRNSETHHSLQFLLHHPRRCYLFLFPARNTYGLLCIQVAINLIAWVMFIVLNINYTPVDPLIPSGLRVFQGLYQSVGLRSSGFYIILISDVAPALQFLYVIIMYISVFPILLSVRQTNIYEERSLGQDDSSKTQATLQNVDKPQTVKSALGQHLRRQLVYDIWWILACVWLVSIIERDKLAPSPPASTTPPEPESLPSPHPAFRPGLFDIIFETVSAYGTVGLSLGVPYENYSFCGTWQSLSKLILMTVMLRGRHRILPMAIDRAILLPGQDIMEEMDRRVRVNEEDEARWQRDEQEVREEEQGGDIEDELDAGSDGGVPAP
ncbi:uncharacterized protein Z519_00468 [Cladophialophora bantiana CBS 173.52]|uniref:Potassium transport protein n=1 Tax=Cladophialophora bantiana (strain ATCC 10958 / CBS 173.52 / CDC B-1940 / NIH 8579) TaxID=1442370 RepID=A0A0D2I6A3_CLAB1|nr:uncharacterized protein Z519_00468 [Cladophialophora bantiana CBS 173.52]KIW98805.1 hypothetical protein Z519_00468 [Cladophialophora bantiana CBS 173.52]